MKVTMHVDISNVNQFLLGNYSSCFYLSTYVTGVEEWYYAGTVEIEVPDDKITELSLQAITEIEKAEKQKTEDYNNDMEALKRRKQELMALPAPVGDPADS